MNALQRADLLPPDVNARPIFSPQAEAAPTPRECLSPMLNEDESLRQPNGKDAVSGGSDGSAEERGTRYPLHFTKGSLIQVGEICIMGSSNVGMV